MATSSIHKEFALNSREEADAFMRLFEESLRNPPKLETPAAVMATETDVQEMVRRWKRTVSK